MLNLQGGLAIRVNLDMEKVGHMIKIMTKNYLKKLKL